jgi:4-diphosphocytidyl-2-C-methyl-D-erythritol kinase
MPTRVRSFSKINLGLAVGPARADGFHELTTVYQTLGLHDFVTVSARRAARTKIRVSADHPGVPRSRTRNAERNTAWKMVAGALERLGLTAEVEIGIEKRLPVQGGMGAGSANAAAALLGMERELGVELDGAERMELAAEVGSDVPLFLLGGTVLGLGRGEEVYPLEDLGPVACVIAVPDVGVSTAAAFRELDARTAAELTSGDSGDKLKKLSRALATVWTTSGAELGILNDSGPSGIAFTNRLELDSGGLSEALKEARDGAPFRMGDVSGDLAENPLLALVRTGIENDFEEVVFSQHPSLRSTKRDLTGSGLPGGKGSSAIYAALSGSGSALFGLYGSQADARAAQHRVLRNGTRAILTETLPRREYWHTMFAE